MSVLASNRINEDVISKIRSRKNRTFNGIGAHCH